MTKDVGAQFPPREEIVSCCDSNPDGFGAMYVSGGKVKVFKTMDKTAFLAWYDQFVKKHPVSTPLVCHMRIATHGSKKVENCHPWVDGKGIVGFAHNGMLRIKNREDMTDSETFFRDLWLPIYLGFGSKAAEKVVNAIVDTSRFAFLFADGHIERWGNWQEGSIKEGVHYTNDSWCRKKASYGGGSYGSRGNYNYGGGVGCGGYGYGDEDDWYSKYTSPWLKKDREKAKQTAIRGCASVEEALKWITSQPEYLHLIEIRAKYKNKEFPYKQRKTTEEILTDELRTNTWGSPMASMYDVYNKWCCKIDEEDQNFLKEFSDKYYAAFPANGVKSTAIAIK